MLRKLKKIFLIIHREIDSKKVVIDEKPERKEPMRDISCTPDRETLRGI